jgi:WD40 repeat protein
MIGEHWLDEQGRRRLHDPHDIVALEITTALERNIRLIPVLVDGAAPPRADDLPAPLAPLARRHAVRLEHTAFKAGVAELVAALERRPETARPQGPRVRPLGELPGRVGSVAGLAFSPDGGYVAAAGEEGVQIWDVTTGVAVSSPGRASGAVRGGRLQPRHPLPRRLQHDREGVALGPDDGQVAAAEGDATVRLRDPATGRPLHVLDGRTDLAPVAELSPYSPLLATGGTDGAVRMWQWSAG